MTQQQEFENNYFQDEDGMFNAEVPPIRACVAWGKTLKECYRNTVDAIESCIEVLETIAAKARFSKERDDKKALQERQKCLTKLAQGGDIPMEVLMSLPSPEEILRRAEEAKAKAAAALAANGQNGIAR